MVLLSLLFACATPGYDSAPVALDVAVVDVYAGQDSYREHEWVDLHVIVVNHSPDPAEVLAEATLGEARIYSKRTQIVPPNSEVDLRLRSKSDRFRDGVFEVTVTVVGEGETDVDRSNNVAVSQPLVFLEG